MLSSRLLLDLLGSLRLFLSSFTSLCSPLRIRVGTAGRTARMLPPRSGRALVAARMPVRPGVPPGLSRCLYGVSRLCRPVSGPCAVSRLRRASRPVGRVVAVASAVPALPSRVRPVPASWCGVPPSAGVSSRWSGWGRGGAARRKRAWRDGPRRVHVSVVGVVTGTAPAVGGTGLGMAFRVRDGGGTRRRTGTTTAAGRGRRRSAAKAGVEGPRIRRVWVWAALIWRDVGRRCPP